MRNKLAIGALTVTVGFLLATNPVMVNAAGQITGKQIKNNSVASKDIKNNSVKGGDVKDDSLTGADLVEASLGAVPNSSALGGKAATAFATASEFVAVSAFDAECDPSSATFLACASVAVNLTRASKLLLSSQTPFGDDSTNGALGNCRLLLDGTLLPDTTTRVGTDATSGGTGADADNEGSGLTNVTAPVAAGAHTVTQQCNETSSDIDFNDLSLSVLAIPAG